MQAGRLRFRVTIQEPIQAKDSQGGVVSNWVDVATVKASIEDRTGREKFVAEQMYSEVDTVITVRALDCLRCACSAWRVIRCESSECPEIYNIVAVIRDRTRKREIRL